MKRSKFSEEQVAYALRQAESDTIPITHPSRHPQFKTDPAFNHTVDLTPDGGHFLDVVQTHDHPPRTRVVELQRRTARPTATRQLNLAIGRGQS